MTAADLPPGPPRLLRDFRPAAGQIKLDYEDFVVEELPLYDPAGAGTHVYLLVEKAGLSTMQAVHDLARALNVGRRDIGYAGLKDARAVTRQWMSIEHIDPDRVRDLEIPRMRILDLRLHTNKLRLGHLKGNRFVIKVRQTDASRLAELQDALALLSRDGVPNYFGQQRFGGRGDAWRIGGAIVRGDLADAIDTMLGRPGELDRGDVRRARELYAAGKYNEAARAWPRMFRDERRALHALARPGGKPQRAFAAIDKATKRFFVSAYQSHLFNALVAKRLESGLGTLLDGDLAWRHANGAVFRVEAALREQERADAFEISPSGPLFGYRMTEPEGVPGEWEREILAAERLPSQAFRSGPLRVKGARRPIRFRPEGADLRLGADSGGAYLELTFSLPRGCYATALLRELFTGSSIDFASDAGESSSDELEGNGGS